MFNHVPARVFILSIVVAISSAALGADGTHDAVEAVSLLHATGRNDSRHIDESHVFGPFELIEGRLIALSGCRRAMAEHILHAQETFDAEERALGERGEGAAPLEPAGRRPARGARRNTR